MSNANVGASDSSCTWETVWNLRCPLKVKIFVWRALLGAIPCRAILMGRHIKVQAQCPICKRDADTIKHLLFDRSVAMEVRSMDLARS